ncbi:MAG: hypothetical protein J6K81_05875 [Rikenellaceae bacterium]|nr:hypothetical protein [Rikenellaceae bacterium]
MEELKRRAVELLRVGERDKARNVFMEMLERDPHDEFARQMIHYIDSIFEFRHKDIYNP